MAGILFLIGFIPYILAIVKRKTRPSKASWIVWTALDAVTLAGMLAKNSVNGQIIGAFAGSCLTVGLALKYGKPGWTWLDKLCLVGGALGILLWKVFGDANFGIVAGMTVVTLGSFPTFVNAWKNPADENKTAWTIFGASCVFAVIAIPAWTLADALQPVVYIAIESVMIFILYARPRMLAK
ncbi:hypothetical protein HZC53_00860 [Candidatus Uhrbacteria bacterium]|nr:hypothetical protein [Candidatus Uhrbacteria bacterium]